MNKWSVFAVAAALGLPQLACASAQSESAGLLEDSEATLLLRNAYFLRDHGDRVQDQSRWGQGFIGSFESGFTRGPVGVGFDAYGLLGVRLDSGKRRDDGGISFFTTDSRGEPLDDVSEAGAAIKLRVSNSILKHGQQLPAMPVLSYDSTRLLPQTFTGTGFNQRHYVEDVAAQLAVLERYGGAGVLPSGAYHLESPTTVTEREVEAYEALLAAQDGARSSSRAASSTSATGTSPTNESRCAHSPSPGR